MNKNHKKTYAEVSNTKTINLPEIIIKDDLSDKNNQIQYEELDNDYLNNAKYNMKKYITANTETIELDRWFVQNAKNFIMSKNYVDKSPKNSNLIITQENYNKN